ncbi:MAG: hypothetical protein HC830_02220 [Bacteroidetes bacterium]|nr:hypothetical protein [Bacteroidota bacterium]
MVKEFDGDKFYWPSSPMADWGKHSDLKAHSGDIHYWDVWWGQKPFEEYETNIGRFMSEYGFQSFPEFNTVKTYTIPADYDIFSDVMKAHQRSSIGNGTIKIICSAITKYLLTFVSSFMLDRYCRPKALNSPWKHTAGLSLIVWVPCFGRLTTAGRWHHGAAPIIIAGGKHNSIM